MTHSKGSSSDMSGSRNDHEILKEVRRWLDDPKERYSVETRDLRRMCWLAEQFLTRSEKRLVEVGELVDIADGLGTCVVEWNDERYNCPAGTKLYVQR